MMRMLVWLIPLLVIFAPATHPHPCGSLTWHNANVDQLFPTLCLYHYLQLSKARFTIMVELGRGRVGVAA